MCIPLYRSSHENGDGASEKTSKVVMVSSASGPGLVFPKGRWQNDETVEEAAAGEALEEAGVRGELQDFLGHYNVNSNKTLKDEFCPEGLSKAAMFALLVKEELQFWPEQSNRQRNWLTIPEAVHSCLHQWMRDALNESFLK
ncbi:nudix hydrolase 16, mitochondrial-like isoform X2 [Prosopis cineraria]|uniref:nudix hydrolase 16, mitochondrial-like isoform X2 n=1 Tax=Prosopis cineraria TaxID=364024 RepID=UPI00240EF7AA|nr:nudix hydrolase 16, mitochondrial-like isoform X2 [Prosopis cineraria]